ncbi:MAG: GspH/FimT family pseudopilin [Neisseriaceae bacterium]|nr:GspH/FimT family pseudopilin [Neisseriaceae bacterium]
MKRRHLKQQGFTLTELMIVVALAAIFATLAVPSFGGMIARQRVQGQANEIANAFTFAHNEAVRRGKPVFVVPAKVKADGKLDDPKNMNGTWSGANALLVFADNGSNNQSYDSGEDLRVVLLNNQVPLGKLTRESLGAPKLSGADDDKMTFVYYSNGQMRIKDKGTALQAPGAIGRIVVKDPKRTTKNQVTRFCEVIRVDATGRTSVYAGKRTDLNKNKDDFFYCE